MTENKVLGREGGAYAVQAKLEWPDGGAYAEAQTEGPIGCSDTRQGNAAENRPQDGP